MTLSCSACGGSGGGRPDLAQAGGTKADGVEAAKKALRFDSRNFIPLGPTCALGSGIIAFFFGKPFMTGYWLPFTIPIFNHFGVPALFDLGVYFAVLGVTLTIIFNAASQKE